MAVSRALLEFEISAPEPAVAWLDDVLADGSGRWVNLEPVVADEDVTELRTRRGVMGWLSARASDLPFVTVVGPGDSDRGGAASLGIQHGAGPKAIRRLREAGIADPAGWQLRQDHSKRGLVFEQAGAVDGATTLTYVLTAVAELMPTEPPPTWSAVLHTP